MLKPAEISLRAIEAAQEKAALPAARMLLLGIMAGMFIGLGAAGANAVSCTVASASLAKLLSGCVFPAGLLMVLVAGAELFTGNCLMVAAVLGRRISAGAMLRNWAIVYAGNLTGGVLTALMVVCAGQMSLFDGALARTTIAVAASKAALPFGQAFLRGVLCNVLVCAAVMMAYAAQSVEGKLAAIFLPVMLFVLSGLEHSVANMYYIPAGLFAMRGEAYRLAAQGIAQLDALRWSALLSNLFAVTLGNIAGGAGLIGAMYYGIYVRGRAE